MYAVIKTGGKQYKVAEGDLLKIEKLEGAVGDSVEFGEVLLVGGDDVKVGTPLVDKAKVKAQIVEQGKDKKIRVFHMKRRKTYRKMNGHRQPITRVKITGIEELERQFEKQITITARNTFHQEQFEIVVG